MQAEELVKAIARAAREIDPSVPLTASGGGFVQVLAFRGADGWTVTVADQNQKMPDSHHMPLTDAELTEDRQGHIDAAAVAVIAFARQAAELSGWTDPGTPVGLEEIARRLGVQRDTADKWRTRGLLPPPRWTVGGRPAWPWPVIEAWARETGRL